MNKCFIIKVVCIIIFLLFIYNNFTNTSENYTNEVPLNNNGRFILFYASWCGHCEDFMPLWLETKKLNSNYTFIEIEYEMLNNKTGIPLDILDMLANDNIVVKGFPTLVYLDKNNKVYSIKNRTGFFKEVQDKFKI